MIATVSVAVTGAASVPLSCGVVSLVLRVVVAGAPGSTVSMVRAPPPAVVVMLPARSVTSTWTLYVPSASAGVIVLSAKLQVPSPLFTAG